MNLHNKKSNILFSLIIISALVSYIISCKPTLLKDDPNEWPHYNHDVHNTKFSALDQINTTNVNGLKLVWQYEDSMENGSSLFLIQS